MIFRLLKAYMLFVGIILPSIILAQEQLSEFNLLYPDCSDKQESTIYGGTYGKWPKNLNLPVFPDGGDVRMSSFVQGSIVYPEVIESVEYINEGKDSIIHLAKGTVGVQIVIDRCGFATRPEIVQSVNEAYDAEAIRIMNELPIFKPGDIDGIRVKVALIVPVYFMRDAMPPKKLEDDYDDFWGDEDEGSDSSTESSDDSDSYQEYNYDDW